MTKRRVLLLALALILHSALMGCGGSEAQPQALQVTQLRAAQLKAVTSETWKQQTYVVRSQDQWLKAWATRGTDVAVYCGSAGLYFCPRAIDAQMPTDIDFSKYTLVGMYTPISGNQVLSLESVIQENQVIKVQTRLSSGLNIQPYFWYPANFLQASWNFFLIPATTLAIEFEQKSDLFVPFKEITARWLHLSSSKFDAQGILKGGNEFNSEGRLIGAGTAAPATFVFDNEADWLAAWRALPAGFYQGGALEIPLIDFNKDMVVGLSFGYGSNGCHGMRIINVVQDKNEINVFYLRSTPSAGSICTANIADLSEYIAIPKSTTPIKFIKYVVGQPI
jgi:hypothetical protein